METVLKKRSIGKDEVVQTVCAVTRRKRRRRRKRDEEKEMTVMNTAVAMALPGGKEKEDRKGQRSEAERPECDCK